jgi:hypothetical protein
VRKEGLEQLAWAHLFMEDARRVRAPFLNEIKCAYHKLSSSIFAFPPNVEFLIEAIC